MAILYTFGTFVSLTPAQFNSYSQIRYSAANLTAPVLLGLGQSGVVNFAAKLGSVSAEVDAAVGADNITTGSGADTVFGNAGDDKIYGGAGHDLLFGDWDDTVTTGNDQLFGGDGNDGLIGGLGNDALYGGAGDDRFFLTDFLSGNDSFFGGSGNDSLLIQDLRGTAIQVVQVVVEKAKSAPATEPAVGTVTLMLPTPVFVSVEFSVPEEPRVTLPKLTALKVALGACPVPVTPRLALAPVALATRLPA